MVPQFTWGAPKRKLERILLLATARCATMACTVYRVCFDLTPCMTSSRLRGIGNYCVQMARAFVRAPRTLLEGIDLLFLVGHGHALRLETLASLADGRGRTGADGNDPILSDPVYYALKYTWGSAYLTAKRLHLVHGTEPKGTSRAIGAACIMTCHDLIPVVRRAPFDPPILPAGARPLIERLRYRTLDHVIAISEFTRRDLCRITGVPADRVTVVYQGVDPDFFSPERDEGETVRLRALLGTARPYFLYVGGFDARKQVPDTVEAFGRCIGELDADLVLCGHLQASERRAIEERVRRTASAGRVVMAGYVPPQMLPALYRGATAHLMFSSHEGFGATLLEAMSCGCPVVALDTSCIPETAGDAALLVRPGSLEAMSDAILRVARSPELRRDLRARGLARARRFSWDRCAAETVTVYRKLLST